MFTCARINITIALMPLFQPISSFFIYNFISDCLLRLQYLSFSEKSMLFIIICFKSLIHIITTKCMHICVYFVRKCVISRTNFSMFFFFAFWRTNILFNKRKYLKNCENCAKLRCWKQIECIIIKNYHKIQI